MGRIVAATLESILEAAKILQGGGIVAFPTETVYGLGANALDAEAVARIFAAKGRPATNPVIVHVSDLPAASEVAEVDARSAQLADTFWPGPLTLVMPKLPQVPDIVTADGPTVGVRSPRHDVAMQLLRAARCPVAAPSANRSEQISPTTAQHVAESLGDAVDLILDGGPCQIGLESTVLDVTLEQPRILRPGMITRQVIEDALGYRLEHGSSIDKITKSPGQMLRHYSPRHPVRLLPYSDILAQSRSEGIAAITYSASLSIAERHVKLSANPAEYATHIYAAMHLVDGLSGTTCILIELPPATPEWEAITDRLVRSAALL